MAVRCSLDDFIRSNTHEVRVSPYSKSVKFPGIGYLVPPEALYDLSVLQGRGFQLEKDVPKGTDISKDPGLAYILDKEGKPTGYRLCSSGGIGADGKVHTSYFLEDDIPLKGTRQERFRRHKQYMKRMDLRRR